MEKLKSHWKSIPSAFRKPVVFMAGTAIVALGLILLPLPGPGWLIIFLGFAVLATEFATAEKIRAWLVEKVKNFVKIGNERLAKFKRRAK